jgi:hypothetical protein
MDSQAPSDVSIDTAAAEAILDGSNYYDVFDPSAASFDPDASTTARPVA